MLAGRRRLLLVIGFVLGLVFIVAVTVVLVRTGDDSPDSNTKTVQSEPNYFTVNITNLADTIDVFPMDDTYSIWSSMWQTVNKNVENDQDYYYGNIRENSIKRYTTTNGLPVVEMLVDLPDIQRSFKLTIEGSAETEYQAAFITCPQAAELVYPPTPCIGQDSE